MSTPVGQSRLQPLQLTHSSKASLTASPGKAVFGRCAFKLPSQLTRKGQAERVGAATRQMLFIARNAVARAHGPQIKLSAVAVVVAHFHGLGEALGRVATAARRAGLLGQRVVLHVPGAPVQRGLDRYDLVAGRKAHQAGVVHFGRVDDALRAEQIERVHEVLDLRKRLRYLRAKLPFNPFAAAQAVAVLAAVGALVVAHQGRGLFGNSAHFGGAARAHVQNRPHMQRTHRPVGVPGAFAAVFFEHLGQRIGVFGQVLQRHGAVFNKADRLAVALEAHHDVEAGLAHFPQVFLRRVVNHFDHRTGQAQVAHQLHQPLDLGDEIGLGVA